MAVAMSDQWIFDPVEWTLTNLTYVTLGLFLFAVVATVFRRNRDTGPARAQWLPSTWLASAAVVSGLQAVGLVVAAIAGRAGDWAEVPAIYAVFGSFFLGAIGVIAMVGRIDSIPRWQRLTQLVASAVACAAAALVAAYFMFS